MSFLKPTPPWRRRAPMPVNWLVYLAVLSKPVRRQIQKLPLQVFHKGPRHFNPRDILLPDGYVAEVVATGFNDPVHCSFDDQGFCYVVESGHKITAKPRVLKVDVTTGKWEVFFDLPKERWQFHGAFTGSLWHDGQFYFMNTGTETDALGALSRLRPDGTIEDLVTGLPWGDHQPNYPVAGPDGKFYWGHGTATNTGVVSPEDYAYGFLQEHPDWHDYPGEDITLAGSNFPMRDVVSGDLGDEVHTGAYAPFGTETRPGQIVRGTVKATGAVLRCNPDGSNLELVAWGLRNPYGIGFHPDGRLFVTEHGIDERGSRYIVGDHDDFYEIEQGAWYGWPDFASGIRLDDPFWGPGGHGRAPVLAEHPNPSPPRPTVFFRQHAGANGFDICRDDAFGFHGDAFVALFGDLAPITTRKVQPSGFKVVRVDIHNRQVFDFAVNRIAGPASKLPHDGFERPSHCQFGPDGALYVVDWGEIDLAPAAMNIREQIGTGALWRIRRTSGPRGETPPPSMVIPYQRLVALGGMGLVGLLAATGGTWLVKRWRRT